MWRHTQQIAVEHIEHPLMTEAPRLSVTRSSPRHGEAVRRTTVTDNGRSLRWVRQPQG